MKVYLDDIREAPEGWVRTYTPKETIELILGGGVEIVSLDHDLGDDELIGTGYDVVKEIERLAYTGEMDISWLPEFVIHSMNPVGCHNMEMAVSSLNRLRYINK